MNAEIGVGMLGCEAHDFGKPRTGHEDARRGDPVFFERLERGAIHRMRHAEIVGMDDEQPRARRIAEPLLNAPCAVLRADRAGQQHADARGRQA